MYKKKLIQTIENEQYNHNIPPTIKYMSYPIISYPPNLHNESRNENITFPLVGQDATAIR